MRLRVVIVEDQPLARLRLRDLLEEVPDVEVVGEAADGGEALRIISNLEPDLVFLDIQMPGPSGVDVLRAMDPGPLTVFTTAHDRHAVAAFELNALDYLLKPFGAERLSVAVDRARETLAKSAGGGARERSIEAFSEGAPLQRVFVRRRARIVPVALRTIEHLEASGDYVTLWEGNTSYLVRVGLTELLERLDPQAFVRIHRSHAVNLDFVDAFAPYDGSRLEVALRSGKRVLASRSRSSELRERFSI